MVVKQLNKREIAASPKAQKALADEFDRLRSKGVWDEHRVREWAKVKQEAQRAGKKVHVGRLFGIAGIKNEGLPEEFQRHKGRFVFEGCHVRDEFGQAAEFAEMSSSPATLEAFKLVDVVASLPGNSGQKADAEQAYVQTRLGGTPTWLRLPRDRWPTGWDKRFHDPVVPMELALYGHPDSGGYWEEHCHAALLDAGFRPVPEWPSMYYQPRLELLLSVYVDDFKMAGPTKNLAKGWKLIRARIQTDDPSPFGRVLGCEHTTSTRYLKNGKQAQVMEYNMEPFLRDCVSKYLELAKKPASSLRQVPTPFLEESDERTVDAPPRADNVSPSRTDHGSPSRTEDDAPLRADSGNSAGNAGTLQNIAARVLMKILYAARMCRFDLLKAVAGLAARVTKWDRGCDRQLHRLVCYINSTLKLRLTGYIGDSSENLQLSVYADADFAGCKQTARSTNGVFLAITGENSFFPIAAVSKRQSCVSHSTAEAEIVAADLAVRSLGLPAKVLLEFVLNHEFRMVLLEDNQATIKIIKNGKSQTLRHLSRTHHINICWLAELVRDKELEVEYIITTLQAADMFTKAFTNLQKWCAALRLSGLVQGVQNFERSVEVPE